MDWFWSLADYYFKRKILGKRIPLIASFKVTYRCNLRCSGCPFHRRSDAERRQMTWREATGALDELQRRGVPIVVFEGGEPLLWRDGTHDFSDLASYAKARFLRVAATTNGTYPLNVPVDILWVSLDGLKETQDRLRSSSFDQVWYNLETTSHPDIMIHLTLNRENWSETEALLQSLKKIPPVRGVTVQLFYPYGQGEAPLALSFDMRKAAIEKIIELKKKGFPIANSAGTLAAMIHNRWTCHDDVLVNVDPDGTITEGCYVKSRGEIHCADCGFTPVAEASRALDLRPGSILAGWRIFLKKIPLPRNLQS